MKIFCGNIDWNISEGQLKKLFEEYGTVDTVTIVQDPALNRSRGFGFVEMPNKDEAEKAIGALNNSTLEGRILRVSIALPPRERSYGGGGGGGFRR
jgi:cold-inducible RNA-binding protein